MLRTNYGIDKNYDFSTSLIDIEKSRELYMSMKQEKEKYEKLEMLTYYDYINTIKHNVSYPFFYGLNEAQEWIRMTKEEKIDNRKKYDEKTYYNFVCSNLEEKVTARKTTIKEIYTCGYSNYASQIEFTVEGCDIVFDLTIPNIENMNSENFEYCNCGELRLGYYSNSILNNYIEYSYKEEDIKSAFEKFMEKFENENKL